jgi:hypothetical protein
MQQHCIEPGAQNDLIGGYFDAVGDAPELQFAGGD